MVDAWSISDDEGRSLVSFSFLHSPYELCRVSSHTYACNIYITIAHCHEAEVLLACTLACCSELGDRSSRCCLGCLSTGIGIDFRVENEDVDIFALSEDMVKSTVTDIICPSVSAEYPDALLDEEIVILLDLSDELFLVSVSSLCKFFSELSGGYLGFVAFISSLELCLSGSLEFFCNISLSELLYSLLKECSPL